MKVILLIWISAVFVREVVPGAIIRHPRNLMPEAHVSERHPPDLSNANPLHSSVHTEYEAKYQQKSQKGNESFSTVKGKQEIVHDNCSDNWNEFAEKCAALIKDLVASLANAISSNPGDTTNLQLQIKNSFRHFDSTNNCSCFNGSDANIKKIGLDLPRIFNKTSSANGGQAHGSPHSTGSNDNESYNLPESQIGLPSGAPNQLGNDNPRQTGCSDSSCDSGGSRRDPHPQVVHQDSTSGTSQPESDKALPIYILGKKSEDDLGSSGKGAETPSEWTPEYSHVKEPESGSSPSKSGKPNLPPYFLPLDVGKQISEGNLSPGDLQTPTSQERGVGQEANGVFEPGVATPNERQSSHLASESPEESQTAGDSSGITDYETPVSGSSGSDNSQSAPSLEHGKPVTVLEPVGVNMKNPKDSGEGFQTEESDCDESGNSQSSSSGGPLAVDTSKESHLKEPITAGAIPIKHYSEENPESGLSPTVELPGTEKTYLSKPSADGSAINEHLETPPSHHMEDKSDMAMNPSESLVAELPSKESNEGYEDSQNGSETALEPSIPVVEKTEESDMGKITPTGDGKHAGMNPTIDDLGPVTTLDSEQTPSLVGPGEMPFGMKSETPEFHTTGGSSSVEQSAHPPLVEQSSDKIEENHGHPLELPEVDTPGFPTGQHSAPSAVNVKPPMTDPLENSGDSEPCSDQEKGEPSSKPEEEIGDGGHHASVMSVEAPAEGSSSGSLPQPSQEHENGLGLIQPAAQIPQHSQSNLNLDSDTESQSDLLPEGNFKSESDPVMMPPATTESTLHGKEPSPMWASEPKYVVATPEESTTNIDQGGRGMTTPQMPTTFQTTSVEPTQPHSLVLPTASTPTSSPHSTTLLLNEPDKSIEEPSSGSPILTTGKYTPSKHHLEDEDEEDEDDECCSCEACDEDPREFRKATCKDLQDAKRELKAIFDKIQKRLKCGRRTSKAITTSPIP